MPITPYLDGFKFDPETRRIMGIAFEMTCAALKFSNRNDLARDVIAKKIIELSKDGVLDPDQLCEQALNDLQEQPQRVFCVAASDLVFPCRPD
jgi:hypothetical protein